MTDGENTSVKVGEDELASLFDGDFLTGVQLDGEHDGTVGPVADPAEDAVPVHCLALWSASRRAIHPRLAAP